MKRELKQASEIAHGLSQGELYNDESDTELLDSLRSVSQYLKMKSGAADRIAAGNLTEGVDPLSDADVLGHSMRNMVEKLRLLVQTQETRERLHNSVKKLLDEVSEVSAGDLTVQAEVGPEITGAIADAFNSMTHNLRSLIKQVKDITQQVGTSASAINETTEQLARGSVAQASQISRTTAAISNMVVQIHEVSDNATLAAKVATQSLNNARLGTKSARENIDAMNCIRKQVQETAKRIKKLGERSQEISQIVSLISDLSDRTSLLALNASLQATSAGTSGSGFGVVADEVERLAERSNKLTQQISALTQTINVETKEVLASMEETIHEVIVGSALADKAGQSLVEIEKVSANLAELLQSISESAKVQAKSSADISTAMSSISDVTELVQLGSKRAAESVRTLVQLSGSLRSSVSPFKLPPEMNTSAPSSPETSSFVN
ncbi:MAG: methyl-accepting chemotaxis protein [Saprospiraceae bacterium]|nr:methyl-accepting chemotaxis protein [Pyrinomonadaceae bacterium]